MSNYPEMDYAAEKAFFAPDLESSIAREIAEETDVRTRKAIEDMAWAGSNEKTSQNVTDRWASLKMWCAHIRQPADKHFPTMMRGLEKDLEDEMKTIDRENVDFDGQEFDSRYGTPFKYELKQYAEVIIDALKDEMSDEESELFEDNR